MADKEKAPDRLELRLELDERGLPKKLFVVQPKGLYLNESEPLFMSRANRVRFMGEWYGRGSEEGRILTYRNMDEYEKDHGQSINLSPSGGPVIELVYNLLKSERV